MGQPTFVILHLDDQNKPTVEELERDLLPLDPSEPQKCVDRLVDIDELLVRCTDEALNVVISFIVKNEILKTIANLFMNTTESNIKTAILNILKHFPVHEFSSTQTNEQLIVLLIDISLKGPSQASHSALNALEALIHKDPASTNAPLVQLRLLEVVRAFDASPLQEEAERPRALPLLSEDPLFSHSDRTVSLLLRLLGCGVAVPDLRHCHAVASQLHEDINELLKVKRQQTDTPQQDLTFLYTFLGKTGPLCEDIEGKITTHPGATRMIDQLPPGTIISIPNETLPPSPESWKLCDGSPVNRSEYPSLSPFLHSQSLSGPWTPISIPASSFAGDIRVSSVATNGECHVVLVEKPSNHTFHCFVHPKSKTWSSYELNIPKDTFASRLISGDGYFAFLVQDRNKQGITCYYTKDPVKTFFTSTWTSTPVTSKRPDGTVSILSFSVVNKRFVICGFLFEQSNSNFRPMIWHASIDAPTQWTTTNLMGPMMMDGPRCYCHDLLYTGSTYLALLSDHRLKNKKSIFLLHADSIEGLVSSSRITIQEAETIDRPFRLLYGNVKFVLFTAARVFSFQLTGPADQGLGLEDLGMIDYPSRPSEAPIDFRIECAFIDSFFICSSFSAGSPLLYTTHVSTWSSVNIFSPSHNRCALAVHPPSRLLFVVTYSDNPSLAKTSGPTAYLQLLQPCFPSLSNKTQKFFMKVKP